MVSFEQVIRRVFSEPAWLLKTIVGAFLVFLPPFALGYIYRVALLARRGHPLELPDWDDWRGLLIDGLRLALIALVLGVGPIFAGWLISLPFHLVPFSWLFSPLHYMLLLPGILLSVPLTAAGLYRYQANYDFKEAFRLGILFRMLGAAGDRLLVPIFAYFGFIFILGPLILLVPYALFTGAVAVFYFFLFTFHRIEADARAAASGPQQFRR